MKSVEVSCSRALSFGGKKYDSYLYDRYLRAALLRDDPCGSFQLILFCDCVTFVGEGSGGIEAEKIYPG